jgi:hypothetical protein
MSKEDHPSAIVRSWHFSEEAIVVKRVSLSGYSGKHLLAASLSHFDPILKSAVDREPRFMCERAPDDR